MWCVEHEEGRGEGAATRDLVQAACKEEVYIYIYRERERDIYIYISREREREREIEREREGVPR